MPDQTDLAAQLRQLAPHVDQDASRELFERHRGPRRTQRLLMPAAAAVLVVAGLLGLVVVTSDDADAPSTTIDSSQLDGTAVALQPEPGETVTAGEEHFEVVVLAETTTGFGNSDLVASDDELTALWAEWSPDVEQPVVDFSRSVVLVMTRPDNACADVVTSFEVANDNGVPVWTPRFEELADACEDPLLSWLHVVAIDRTALGDRARIRVPAAELYDVAEQTIEYTASIGEPVEPADSSPVTLTATDVVVALPPVGTPRLHNTSIGMFYVVHHDDGTVSVLPATIARGTNDDEGVTMLQTLVVASESGDSFFGDGDVWDARGRAVTAGRASDLVGYAGRVDGDEVDVFVSTATRVEGDPDVPDGEDYPLPPRPPFEAITPEQFVTLSSSGPIWRQFDASLVVEAGVGRICQVDTSVPVDQLDGCDESGVVIDTLVTSIHPDITTWYEPPVLAFQDPVRGFTNVIPLGGYSSRNDADLSTPSATSTPPETTTVDHTTEPYEFSAPVPAGSFTATQGDLIVLRTNGDLEYRPGALTGGDDAAIALVENPDPREEVVEGPGPNVIDSVAGIVNGSIIYGDCCEPAAGNIYALTEPMTAPPTPYQHGYSPTLSPDHTRLITGNDYAITAVDTMSGDGIAIQPNPGPGDVYRAVFDLEWIDNERFVVLFWEPDIGLELVTFDAASLGEVGPSVGIPGDIDPNPVRFAGRTPNGSIAVEIPGSDDTTIRYYDPDTLTEQPDLTQTFPATISAVAVDPGGLGQIWVDDSTLYHRAADATNALPVASEVLAAWFVPTD